MNLLKSNKKRIAEIKNFLGFNANLKKEMEKTKVKLKIFVVIEKKKKENKKEKQPAETYLVQLSK